MIVLSFNYEPEKCYRKFLDNEDMLIYRYQSDYYDCEIIFDKRDKGYYFHTLEWQNNDEGNFVPMGERGSEWLKHCARYGHWQKIDVSITLELHKFVNEIIKELGW